MVAVQNPLTSLADDVAATERAIALADGPVILVGHSYGGAIIAQGRERPESCRVGLRGRISAPGMASP